MATRAKPSASGVKAPAKKPSSVAQAMGQSIQQMRGAKSPGSGGIMAVPTPRQQSGKPAPPVLSASAPRTMNTAASPQAAMTYAAAVGGQPGAQTQMNQSQYQAAVAADRARFQATGNQNLPPSQQQQVPPHMVLQQAPGQQMPTQPSAQQPQIDPRNVLMQQLAAQRGGVQQPPTPQQPQDIRRKPLGQSGPGNKGVVTKNGLPPAPPLPPLPPQNPPATPNAPPPGVVPNPNGTGGGSMQRPGGIGQRDSGTGGFYGGYGPQSQYATELSGRQAGQVVAGVGTVFGAPGFPGEGRVIGNALTPYDVYHRGDPMAAGTNGAPMSPANQNPNMTQRDAGPVRGLADAQYGGAFMRDWNLAQGSYFDATQPDAGLHY